MTNFKRLNLVILICLMCGRVTADGISNRYETLMEANQIDAKSSENRLSFFKQFFDGITNFPNFRDALKVVMHHATAKEKLNVRNMFDVREKKLVYEIRKRALFAGATGKAADTIATLSQQSRLNDEIAFAHGFTYLTEVISCQHSVLFTAETVCTKSFVQGYDALEIVKILVENGADVNQPEELRTDTGELISNRTPLMLASDINRADIVQYLLLNGANPRAKTSNGHTALDIAASNNFHGRSDKVIALLKKALAKR